MLKVQKLTSVALLIVVCLALCVNAQNFTHVSWLRLFPSNTPFRQWHAGAFTGLDFVVYGGLDNSLFAPTDQRTYNYDANYWSKNATSATSGRNAFAYVQRGNTIVAYGGFLGNARTSSTMFLDIDTFSSFERAGSSGDWTINNPDGNLIHMESPCTDPTAVIDDNENMWIFGGLTSIVMLNQVTRVDLKTNTVYGVSDTTSNRPSRRYATASSFIVIGGTRYMFLFGGLRQKTPQETATTLGDEALFDIDANDWGSVSGVLGGSRSPPDQRAYASLHTFPNHTGMILYGGSDHTGTSTVNMYDDAWFFDNSGSFLWTKMTYMSASFPSARSRVASAIGSKNGELSLTMQGGQLDGGAANNEIWKLVFDPCPYGAGNCFTNDPFRNNTGGGSGGTTTGGPNGAGGAAGGDGDGSSNPLDTTGLVSIGPSSMLSAFLNVVF